MTTREFIAEQAAVFERANVAPNDRVVTLTNRMWCDLIGDPMIVPLFYGRDVRGEIELYGVKVRHENRRPPEPPRFETVEMVYEAAVGSPPAMRFETITDPDTGLQFRVVHHETSGARYVQTMTPAPAARGATPVPTERQEKPAPVSTAGRSARRFDFR